MPNKHRDHLSGHTVSIESVKVRQAATKSTLPENYDFTKVYSFSQKPIQQGLCGSCWSISTTQCLRDRANLFKITKDINSVKIADIPPLSFQLVADCAMNCITYRGRSGCAKSCNGGFLVTGFSYLQEKGTTADNFWPNRYNSEDGLEHIEVVGQNENTSHLCPRVPLSEPRFKCHDFYIVNLFDTFGITNARADDVGMNSMQLKINEENIQREIFERGPVAVCFNLYSDFRSFWKNSRSKDLVYKVGWNLPNVNINPVGSTRWNANLPGPGGIVFKTGHSVTIVGWGEQPSADGQSMTKYWICRNSWGQPDRTYNSGYFKILRGVNTAAIESDVAACWFRNDQPLAAAAAAFYENEAPNQVWESRRRSLVLTVLVFMVILVFALNICIKT